MKTKFYNYDLGNSMLDRDGKELRFAILVHGFDTDIRGHRLESRSKGTNTRIVYDPVNPFILIPENLLLDAVSVFGGDLISASPIIGDFDADNVESCNEGVNRAFEETYKMMIEFDVAHKMYGSGDRLTMIGSNNGKKPIRKTYNVIWDDKDTELHVATKEVDLDKAVEDLHAHLRPIKTQIGTCYECDAVIMDGWSSSICSRIWRLDGDEIDANAERVFGLALHRYSKIWDDFASRHADILAKHADEIFDTPVDTDEINSEYISSDLRLVLKDAVVKCLKDSVNFQERVKEFTALVDSIDEEDLLKLAQEDYKEGLRHIEDKFAAAEPSITQEIMENRIDTKIDAYRAGGLREVFPDDEEYYDI